MNGRRLDWSEGVIGRGHSGAGQSGQGPAHRLAAATFKGPGRRLAARAVLLKQRPKRLVYQRLHDSKSEQPNGCFTQSISMFALRTVGLMWTLPRFVAACLSFGSRDTRSRRVFNSFPPRDTTEIQVEVSLRAALGRMFVGHIRPVRDGGEGTGVCAHCLVTLSLTINETLKWLSSLPILMQESFWWWQCSDRYIISLSPHLHTTFPPFSPSLISLVVSVDVKHHVYLLFQVQKRKKEKKKTNKRKAKHRKKSMLSSSSSSFFFFLKLDSLKFVSLPAEILKQFDKPWVCCIRFVVHGCWMFQYQFYWFSHRCFTHFLWPSPSVRRSRLCVTQMHMNVWPHKMI